MGWLIYHPGSFPRTPAEYRQEITRLCTFETDDFTAAPVATGVVGTTWYVANRYRPKHPGAALPTPELFELDAISGYTVGIVFLTRLPSQSDGWGYKDMDETMGPTEAKAPAKVLDALSPIIGSGDRADWARKWRQRCRDWTNRPQLCEGVVIETDSLIDFSSGMKARRFEMTLEPHGRRRRRVWIALDAGRTRCRLSERDLASIGFRIIGHRDVPGSVPEASPSA